MSNKTPLDENNHIDNLSAEVGSPVGIEPPSTRTETRLGGAGSREAWDSLSDLSHLRYIKDEDALSTRKNLGRVRQELAKLREDVRTGKVYEEPDPAQESTSKKAS